MPSASMLKIVVDERGDGWEGGIGSFLYRYQM